MNKKKDSFLLNLIKGLSHRLNKISSDKNTKAGLSWFKIKKLKHLPYNHPGNFAFKGSVVHFNNGPELLHSLQEIFSEDIYDIPFKTPTPYIIDCGANIGLSVLYLKIRNPESKIIAFEPDPANFALLSKNILSYNLQNVELRNEAIWRENTTLEFVSDGTLGSKLSSSEQEDSVVKVKASRLKDLLGQKIDFLKIDIEGAEYEVLKDCGNSLENVDHLFIEYHGFFRKINELNELLQLVHQTNFSYYIKEASNVYPSPFNRGQTKKPYDLQLNIFCFRISQ